MCVAETVPSGRDYLSRGLRSESDLDKGHSSPSVGRDRGSPRRLGVQTGDCCQTIVPETRPAHFSSSPRGGLQHQTRRGPSFKRLMWPRVRLAPAKHAGPTSYTSGGPSTRSHAGRHRAVGPACRPQRVSGRTTSPLSPQVLGHGGSSRPPPRPPRTRSVGKAHPVGGSDAAEDVVLFLTLPQI